MKYLLASNRWYQIRTTMLLLACGAAHAEMTAVPPSPSAVPPPEVQQLASQPPTLTQPGNSMFGAIKEVLRQLEADPNTDWKKVNLEALRQHFLDIRHFTEDVEIITQKPLDKGIEIIVRATTPAAIPALDRAFSTQPKVLKSETDWDMTASKDKDKYKLRVTTGDASKVDKLRGLGYIGIMAVGNQHPALHWALAKGQVTR